MTPADAAWAHETLRRTLEARRFYATYNETLQLRVQADGAEMGETVTAPAGDTIHVDVDAVDPVSDAAIEAIALYSNGATEVARTALDSPTSSASLTYEAAVPTEGTRWYVAKVVGPDGREGPTRGSAYSSPIWLEGR